MKFLVTTCTAVAAAALLAAGAAHASATVGQPAPAFTAVDTSGRSVSLADFKGRHVVLEWVNPGCPYVRKHYDGKNMQATQALAASKGMAWLTINSTAPEFSDHMAPQALAAWMNKHGAKVSATLMDESGTVGRAYGARVTPHMYVIDPQGTLVYAGAIDDRPTARVADIQGATNHVKVALEELAAGKPVGTPTTRAYGCTIKYGNAG